MSLYEEWENSVNENRSKEEYNQFWTDYFKAEAENYKKILLLKITMYLLRAMKIVLKNG